MQYYGKYSRRGFDCDKVARRMPYTKMGNCGCDDHQNAPMEQTYENNVSSCADCKICNLTDNGVLNGSPCGHEHCEANNAEWCDQHFSLAMGYVYPQDFDDLNESDEALCHGTLFRKLDMPFYGQRKRY